MAGGHVNPVVTVAVATLGKFPWKKVPHYLVAQYLGGFLATVIAYVNHHSSIAVFDGGVRSSFYGNGSTAGIFTSHPPEDELKLTLFGALFDQVLMCFCFLK